MTHRERLENKMQRRLDWADSRNSKAASSFNRANAAVQGIEPGQPILVGHHSERHHRKALERHDNAMHKAFESQDMAAHHRGAAAGIERQLDRSVFSDDDNAIQALTARIAEREAEAGRIKAYNKSCRTAAKTGGRGDMALLSDTQKADIISLARVCSYQIGLGGSFPAYESSNLRGRITADRKRIEEIKHRVAITAEAAQSETGYIIKGEDYINIMFAEKPEREIIDALKASGFCWSGGCWCGYREKLPAILNVSQEPQTATA